MLSPQSVSYPLIKNKYKLIVVIRVAAVTVCLRRDRPGGNFHLWVLGKWTLSSLCSNDCTWKNKDEKHQWSSSMTGEVWGDGPKSHQKSGCSQWSLRLLFGLVALPWWSVMEIHMVAGDPQANRNLSCVHVCWYFIHCGTIWNLRWSICEKQKYWLDFILFFCVSEWFLFPLMHDWYKTGQEQTTQAEPLNES